MKQIYENPTVEFFLIHTEDILTVSTDNIGIDDFIIT